MTTVIRIGREQARTGPWRGDHTVAYLAPTAQHPVPSADFIRQCLDVLADRGFRRVVTGALSPSEQTGFLAAGFQVEERLHLLGHDLIVLPEARPSPVSLRRARRSDRAAVLEVDHQAFPPFWQLDGHGLDEALAATPRSRFRVAETSRNEPNPLVPNPLVPHRDVGDAVSGYAIFGRAGTRGYVQRLAVHPALHGRGVGRALMVDGLAWLHRRGVARALVNTQVGNAGALHLYESLGFRMEAVGLSVLAAGVPA